MTPDKTEIDRHLEEMFSWCDDWVNWNDPKMKPSEIAAMAVRDVLSRFHVERFDDGNLNLYVCEYDRLEALIRGDQWGSYTDDCVEDEDGVLSGSRFGRIAWLVDDEEIIPHDT